MKRLLFIIMWYAFVNASEPCTEPLYYEVEFNDDVTHLWSREVYHDIYGNVESLDSLFALKYNGLSNDKIDVINSRQIMEDNTLLWQARRDSILNTLK